MLTRADELTCPSCHAQLELSRPSKALEAFVGLLVAWIAYRVAHLADGEVMWLIPMVSAVLGYAAGSAFALLALADLVVRPKASAGNFPHTHG